MTFAKTVLISALLSGSLSGCLASQPHLSSDFGAAVRQDMVAQIADPDARYTGDPAPGSNGGRVALAQDRYRKGTVIAPATTGASTIGQSGAAPAPQQ